MYYSHGMEHTQHSQTHTAATICDMIGRKAIADRVGVKLAAVSNASTEGMFPAKWFAAIKSMCGEAGIDCPESLFRFAGVQQ
jgi:hypothetical protein